MTGSEMYCKLVGVSSVEELFHRLYPPQPHLKITPQIMMTYLDLIAIPLKKRCSFEELAYKLGLSAGAIKNLGARLKKFNPQAYQAVYFDKDRVLFNFNLSNKQAAEQLGWDTQSIRHERVKYLHKMGMYDTLKDLAIPDEKAVQLTGLPLVYVKEFRSSIRDKAVQYANIINSKRKRMSQSEVDKFIAQGYKVTAVEKYCRIAGFKSAEELCYALRRNPERELNSVVDIINKKASGLSIIDVSLDLHLQQAYVRRLLIALKKLDATAYNYAMSSVVSPALGFSPWQKELLENFNISDEAVAEQVGITAHSAKMYRRRHILSTEQVKLLADKSLKDAYVAEKTGLPIGYVSQHRNVMVNRKSPKEFTKEELEYIANAPDDVKTADLARVLGRYGAAVSKKRKQLKAGIENASKVLSKHEIEEMVDPSMSVSEASLKFGVSEHRVRAYRDRARKEKGKND